MSVVTEFLNSFAGMVGAAGTLLLGIAAILSSRPSASHSTPRRKVAAPILAIFGAVLLAISSAMFSVPYLTADDQPLNVQLTTAAWESLNDRRYDDAISTADECISRYQHSADSQQGNLEHIREPSPPVGAVPDKEKSLIFSRGLLNDVATCFFIKGEAAGALRKIDTAKQAYQAASEYTYARAWDPKGWFWSPSDEALARISHLKQ